MGKIPPFVSSLPWSSFPTQDRASNSLLAPHASSSRSPSPARRDTPATPASARSERELLLESPRDPLELHAYQDGEEAAEPSEDYYNVHKLPLNHKESEMYVNVTDSVYEKDDYESVDGLLKEQSVATPSQERRSPMEDQDLYVEMKPGDDGDSHRGDEDSPTDEYVEMAPHHDSESRDGPDDVYTEIVPHAEVGSYVEMQPHHIGQRPGNVDARGYVNLDYTKETDGSTSSSGPTFRPTRSSTGTPTKIKTPTKRDKAMTELFFPSSPAASRGGKEASEAKLPPMPDNMPITDGGEEASGEDRDEEADDTEKELLYQNVEEWTNR